jgi:hypothetical protein
VRLKNPPFVFRPMTLFANAVLNGLS